MSWGKYPNLSRPDLYNWDHMPHPYIPRGVAGSSTRGGVSKGFNFLLFPSLIPSLQWGHPVTHTSHTNGAGREGQMGPGFGEIPGFILTPGAEGK